jgi:hypothetical protein
MSTAGVTEWLRRWKNKPRKLVGALSLIFASGGVIGAILALANIDKASDIAQVLTAIGVFLLALLDFFLPTYSDQIHQTSLPISQHTAIYGD